MTSRHITFFLLAAAILTYVLPPHVRVYNYPADDAYFYAQVARNIQAGNGSTFNQITRTNGYHPLWMLMCAGCFQVAGGHPLPALHLALALQQAMGLLAVLLFFKLARALRLDFAYAALPLLAAYATTRLYLSEAYPNAMFVLLMLCAGWRLFIRDGKGSAHAPAAFLGTGALAGGAVLARLDNIFLAGVFMLAAACSLTAEVRWHLFKGPVIARGTALAGGFLLVFVPYLLVNRYSFGHWMPVSGAIKSTLPQIIFNPDGLSGIGKLAFLFAALGPLLCLAPNCDAPRRRIVLILSGGVLLHSAQIVLTTSHHTHWPWYYVAGMINAGLCLALLAEAACRLPFLSGFRPLLLRILPPAALALALAANGYAALRYRSSAPTIAESFQADRLRAGEDLRWQQRIAGWMKENLPPDTAIAVYDWPGMLAYTSGMRILPIDGLINDYQYNDDLLAEGAADYLRARNVTHWLGPRTPEAAEEQNWYGLDYDEAGVTVEVLAPLYKKSAGTFRVENDAQIVRLQDVIDHRDVPDLALWRIGGGK